MTKRALIIRNIETLDFDEAMLLLEGVENKNAPPEFGVLVGLMQRKDTLNDDEKRQVVELARSAAVCNYLFSAILEKTGNIVICHANAIDDSGRAHDKVVQDICNKITKIPHDVSFDLMYLGGGHGDPKIGSSNLSAAHLKKITTQLAQNGHKFNAIILGSCFSAAYHQYYYPLLSKRGVMIGHSLECGGENNFRASLEWIHDRRASFFTEDEILQSKGDLQARRSALRRAVHSPELVAAYQSEAFQALKAHPENHINPSHELSNYDLFVKSFGKARDNLQKQNPLFVSDKGKHVSQLSPALFEAIYNALPDEMRRIVDVLGSDITGEVLKTKMLAVYNMYNKVYEAGGQPL